MEAVVATAVVAFVLELGLRRLRLEGPLKIVLLFMGAALTFLGVTALLGDEEPADMLVFALVILVAGGGVALRLRYRPAPPPPPRRRERPGRPDVR